MDDQKIKPHEAESGETWYSWSSIVVFLVVAAAVTCTNVVLFYLPAGSLFGHFGINKIYLNALSNAILALALFARLDSRKSNKLLFEDLDEYPRLEKISRPFAKIFAWSLALISLLETGILIFLHIYPLPGW